jgi:hypothetical protein
MSSFFVYPGRGYLQKCGLFRCDAGCMNSARYVWNQSAVIRFPPRDVSGLNIACFAC